MSHGVGGALQPERSFSPSLVYTLSTSSVCGCRSQLYLLELHPWVVCTATQQRRSVWKQCMKLSG